MAAQFGLDLGSSSIKVVQLSGDGDKYRVEAVGIGVNPVGNIQTDSNQELGEIAEAIRKTIKDAGVKGTKVRTALSEAVVYSRVIELPALSEAELSSALSWEAEQYIPIPIAEVNLDWQVLSRPSPGSSLSKMLVFLVAAPKKAVERMVRLMQSAGLEPVGLETEILALARSLVTGEQSPPTLLCHLGAMGTDLALMEQGKPVFVAALATGGMALTRVVSQSLSLEFNQAEQYKRSYGVDQSQLEGKIAQAMMPVLAELVAELRKALNFYAGRNPAVGIKRMVLSGGGAQMPGLTGFLAAQLNLEVIVGDPLAGFAWNKNLTQRFEGLQSVFAIATGLAMAQE